ncbi:hypothetical protein M9H77_06545 [Catharanthus roseus]|uniref:Uncharacterized protein n=1 Tax=Catharanthus roseus TaxID=4058 RepID=A0ACC0BSD9_CATRO|nr:hypothetical protein M9H77_06545 [Catharanthus roseus]
MKLCCSHAWNWLLIFLQKKRKMVLKGNRLDRLWLPIWQRRVIQNSSPHARLVVLPTYIMAFQSNKVKDEAVVCINFVEDTWSAPVGSGKFEPEINGSHFRFGGKGIQSREEGYIRVEIMDRAPKALGNPAPDVCNLEIS